MAVTVYGTLKESRIDTIQKDAYPLDAGVVSRQQHVADLGGYCDDTRGRSLVSVGRQGNRCAVPSTSVRSNRVRSPGDDAFVASEEHRQEVRLVVVGVDEVDEAVFEQAFATGARLPMSSECASRIST